MWWGVSIEDKERPVRIYDLRNTPAAVRFLSCEPLIADLGPLYLGGIDWVIAGGESGPNARPMHPDWVRALRDQCVAAGVPFFMKRWGEFGPIGLAAQKWIVRSDGSSSPCPTPNGIGHHAARDGSTFVYRVGKKAAGALLDGREWRQFPARQEEAR
ncbi:MAG: DUF5131 family protein [Acetobacteraceae bacterium]